MENLEKVGRIFFAIGMIGLGIQQFQYGEFRPVFLPPWPISFQTSAPAAYLFGLALILAGILLIIGKFVKKVSLLMGAIFLILFLIFQVPYTLFIQPNSPLHLGLWINPIKELAFSGSAFIIAGYYNQGNKAKTEGGLFGALETLIPMGRIFFGFMLATFGLSHFYYPDFVATLVPDWIPGHMFWTYFAAIALMGAGIAIILKFRIVTISLLTGTMLFLWFLILHLPRGISALPADKGNEMTSVFEALAFSGIAFILAATYKRKSPVALQGVD